MDQPIPRRDIKLAEGVMARLPQVLAARGLQVSFDDWLVTRWAGLSLLFGVVNVGKVERLEALTSPALIHHLTTGLNGLPVFLSNRSGLRYVVLLNKRPALPEKVELAAIAPGWVQLGIKASGEALAVPWDALGHLLVAGMTGSGKSGFLRLLAFQAIHEGAQLLVSDVNQTTLPMLAGHAALMAPIATTAAESVELVERALGECENRAALFGKVPGYPEKLSEYNKLAPGLGLDPLRRVLVILDECSDVLQASGGGRGTMGEALARLSWQGRKFGVSVIFAATDFTKELVGPVRDQIGTAICFRVNSAIMAARVGCAGAERIRKGRPGLAITNLWGPVQTYFLPKSRLIYSTSPAGELAAIPGNYRTLALRALKEAGGRMSLGVLQHFGLSEREARRLAESWENRGWLERGPNRARMISSNLRDLLGMEDQ